MRSELSSPHHPSKGKSSTKISCGTAWKSEFQDCNHNLAPISMNTAQCSFNA
jgi:hypothetical protein